MNVIGLELVVPRIDDAIDFFDRVLGLELVWRGRHADAPGDAAVLDAGSIALTLLQLDDAGAGIVADRSPRLSRLTFDAMSGDASLSPEELVGEIERCGVPVRPSSRGVFIPPEVADGVLGFPVALMLDAVAESE